MALSGRRDRCRPSGVHSSARRTPRHSHSGGPILMKTPRATARIRRAFSLPETLVVVIIILALLSLLLPLVGTLRESSRRNQARRVVGQIDMALREYRTESPTKSLPPAEPDGLIRWDPSDQQPHLINFMATMQMDGGIQQRAPDPQNGGLFVLLDPWRRPYHYVLDAAGSSDPTQAVQPSRPDPALLNWNALNLVPFGYVWSLGSPLHGHQGQMTNDPDAAPGTGAPWIYTTSTPAAASP
jgi:type II secretory pathway pseudopilin PulG